MNYNKSEIMSAAWAMYRGLSRNLRGEIIGTFADCLRMAWASAKRNAQRTPEERLFLLNMKDRWNSADFEEARKLEQEISSKKDDDKRLVA